MRHSLFTLLVFASVGCGSPDTTITRLTPDITVAPEQIAFGEVVPSFTIDQTIHVVNSGRTTLEVSSLGLSDENQGFSIAYEFPVDDEGVPVDIIALERAESLAVTVSFTPEDFTEYSSILQVASNDEDTPTLEVLLSGAGVIGPEPDISIDVEQIDFGDVATGDISTEYLLVNNVGDAPLSMVNVQQGGSGAFAVVTDPTGQNIAPGGSATVLVNYSPDGGMSGHTGTITFVTDDPDEPEVSVELVGGDGGPDASYPVAMITGDGEVNPPARVSLDGSGSVSGDGNDDDLIFAWSIADKPFQSNATVDGDNASTAYVDIDIAGSYAVQLIVTDPATGMASAPSRHSINARPLEELYIALTWDKADTDLDLHVVPNGGMFWSDADVSFCNPELDWGDEGLAVFSGEVSDGYGPESVTITGMADTSYHIGVHYFEDNRGADVMATVTVYLNGEPYGTFTQELSHNYFWKAGYIRIEEGEGSIVESDEFPFFSSTRECSE
jgi:hypothetical protein